MCFLSEGASSRIREEEIMATPAAIQAIGDAANTLNVYRITT